MQFHSVKKFFVLSVLFFSACLVHANSVVQTEFEMLLPRSFQQNLIEKVWENLQRDEFHFNWSLPDQTYDTPDVKVLLSGLHLDVKTKLQRPQLGSEGESVLLESRGLEANLTLDSVSIDQYIEREIGGVIGRFRIQARCENVNLHMKPGKAVLTMKLSPVFDRSLLRAQVDDANLSWTPDAWEVGALNCTGAQGFDDIIKEEIAKMTGDASIVTSQKAKLMEFVREYVSSKSLDLSTPRNLVTSRPDIQVSLRVTNFSGTESNAVVRGLLRVVFTQTRSTEQVNLQLGTGGLGSSQTPVLRIPESFVLAVAKQAYAGNSWVERVSSDEIPGFSTLMKSRLTQFFVWRELMNFSKSAKFLFDVYSPKNISVTGRQLSYDVKAPLYAKMYAPKSGKYVPFMNFTVPLESKVKLSLNNGKITSKFTNVALEINEQWDPDYVAKYNPSKKFASSKIESRILSAAEGKTLSYTLPAIPVSDDISLILQRAQSIKDGDLLLYLTEPGAVPAAK